MQRILITTALTAALALPLRATDQAAPTDAQMQQMGVTASTLIDRTVYMVDANAQTGTDRMSGMIEIPANWRMVGEVDDVVLSDEGDIRALIVDAGGSLGIGETEKRIDLENIRFVPSGDTISAFFLIFTGDRSKFAEQLDYVAGQADAAGTMLATENFEIANDPARREEKVDRADLTANDLRGIGIYGINDNWIGDLREVARNDNGQIMQAIIDVGRYLGMTEKPVAIRYNQIEMRRTGWGDLRGYVDTTWAALERMPEWSGAKP